MKDLKYVLKYNELLNSEILYLKRYIGWWLTSEYFITTFKYI